VYDGTLATDAVDKRWVRCRAEAHGGHFKEAVEKVIDTQPPKHIATIVEQTIAGGKKEKTDLEFLLKQEVVGNGNDFLGIAILTAADLPQVHVSLALVQCRRRCTWKRTGVSGNQRMWWVVSGAFAGLRCALKVDQHDPQPGPAP
jgi:hypothetical protein